MISFLPVTSDSEIQRVVKLANVVWPQHYDPIIGNAQVEYMLDKFQNVDAIKSQITEGYEYYITGYDRQDVGYLSYSIDDNGLFLSKIYVLGEFQGRGFGKASLKFVKEKAESKRIWLTVNKMNTGSIAFYEKQGFTKSDEVVTDIGGGFVMDDFVMEA